LKRFLKECVRRKDGNKVTATKFFEQYENWCEKNNQAIIFSTPSTFAKALKELNPKNKLWIIFKSSYVYHGVEFI